MLRIRLTPSRLDAARVSIQARIPGWLRGPQERGAEAMAQTDVRQDAADYSRLASEWKASFRFAHRHPRGRMRQLATCTVK